VGTYVFGANLKDGADWDPGLVISNASCTTNCVSPIASILHSKIGILKGTMTTIHAYTSDQSLHDGSHKDLRRARAAAANIIPTTTGAAEATTKTIVDLKGKFDGMAIRVPVLVGSLSDFVVLTKKKTTVSEVNNIFIEAAEHPLYKGIVAVTDRPLVSSDIVGRDESAIVDLSFTRVVDGDLVKIVAWYDNEWAYCRRLVEEAALLGKQVKYKAL
jgi:glyceraldehyde-3-phosphate dehydrogenase type I